jgi:tRNA (guanine26-N2/guanine27-N2)-dimethyltransferase
LVNVAAKHDVGVNVVFSHRGEHYIRVYAKIKYGARNSDESIGNVGFILHCFKCFHREVAKGLFEVGHSRKCSECGSTMSIAGPLWLGNLSDAVYCSMMKHEVERRKFKLRRKVERMLALIENESGGPITYFVIDKLCDALNLPVPSVKSVIKALEKEGFQASLTHFTSRGIRSDVPAGRLAEIINELTGTASGR